MIIQVLVYLLYRLRFGISPDDLGFSVTLSLEHIGDSRCVLFSDELLDFYLLLLELKLRLLFVLLSYNLFFDGLVEFR